MPSADQILNGLQYIANTWQQVAVFLLLLASGVRPTMRFTGLLLSLPLFSVSIVAWLSSNPFNGAIFAVVASVLALLAARLPGQPIRFAATHFVITAVVVLFRAVAGRASQSEDSRQNHMR